MFVAKAASVLQSRLLGDKDQWISAAMTWRRLQRELERRRAAVNTSSTALGMTTKQEEGSRSDVEERCNVESRRSGGQSRENGSGGLGGGEQSRAWTLEKKRKRDDEEEKTIAAQDFVSFRISCKCTGSLSRYFSIQVDDVIHLYKSTCEAPFL